MEVGVQMPSPPLNFGRSSPCSAARASGGRFFFMSAPASPNYHGLDDFAFHVGKAAAKPSVFAGGRIRLRKPPAHHPFGGGSDTEPPASLTSPLLSPLGSPDSKSKRSRFWSALTFKGKKNTNPFESDERGRERNPNHQKSTPGRRATRSVSPNREGRDHPWEAASSSSTVLPAKSGRKWGLKNFLLFRSASEGRAYADKDPLRKFAAFNRSEAGRRDGVSAHERYYREKKAASEDMKKKTFLPYKQGILGRPAVNPALHAPSTGSGSLATG